MPVLEAFKRNVHSQNGEDGIIEEILARLSIGEGMFVEFGAWDGRYLSNTYALLEKGWQGVYIEGDQAKYDDLVRNMGEHSANVDLLCAFVEPAGDRSLDKLLARTRVGSEFEVLSVDVDSCDWQIWQGLHGYRPKIVVIEVNSLIPVGIYQTHRGGDAMGSSFTAMVDLGARKGYSPVCHTGNVIFVRNDLVGRLGLPEVELLFPESLFDYRHVQLCYERSKDGPE